WFEHREDATVWLDPAAADHEPWARLRESLELRFPLCASHAHGFTPHLSLGRTPNPHLLARKAEALLGPMTARVDELVLLSRRSDEPMRVRARILLGSDDPPHGWWAPRCGRTPTSSGRARPSIPGSVSPKTRRKRQPENALAR
ncbi:2'-5' RNA ligase family protein, partial [Streptomyces sp. NPDC058430]|uniref:2'-5' RNA ligase family protein n=1 Tax=Streptomyces sp. NPDC058430 TaxID=3346495 RepID=UPI003660F626